MKYTTTLLASALILTMPMIAEAAHYGYCTDVTSRNYIFRVGTTEEQGMAIKLDSGKLQTLKGQTITGISVVYGSKNTTNNEAHLFIKAGADGTELRSQTVTIKNVIKWIDHQLDSPYTITGDEGELMIGYTAEINPKTMLLTADHTADTEGCSLAYGDGAWVDTKGLGVGNVSLRIITAESPSITDLMLKPVAVEGYFRSGDTHQFAGQVFNFGSEPITSFDLSVSIDGKAPAVQSYSGLNLAQGQIMDLVLPEFSATGEGSLPLAIEVKNVNGATDADASDNMLNSDLFYYPQDMERSIFIEGFTGQMCNNCPAGHSTLEKFVQEVTEPVIEVMHHAGYTPDFYTMDADLDYTFFYGSSSTYAPAVMINRAHVPTIGSVPVMNLTGDNLKAAYNAVRDMQPYVSMALSTTYDATTRQVEVTLQGYVHNDLPADVNILNVMLVQDNVKGMQVPYGNDYIHNGVMRTVLTGNSWGVMLEKDMCKSGSTLTWTKSFELAEGIFSDAYNWETATENERIAYTLATVPEEMRIVAYVASYENGNFNGHTVYNAVEAPIGQSYTQGGMAGINDATTDHKAQADVYVNAGRIHVVGDYDSLSVYTIAGKQLDPRATLQPGAYVVRVVHGKEVTTKKIMVK